VEAESHFDLHGGPRNHDAVVHGHLPDGRRVVVCVEAKAGEALGQTVEQYAKAAQHKLEQNTPTHAPKRLEKLLERYAGNYDVGDDRVRLMRYQLLSALAGTETEAAAAGADHAILMIHEFVTDQRPTDKTTAHMADFSRFTTSVFDCEHPGADELPWCFEVLAPSSMHARLYLAWAVTDLRTKTLES
jgi:hypothetical protein